MSGDELILGVAPVGDVADLTDLEQPPLEEPAVPEAPRPPKLDRQGRAVLEGVLRLEGELVRSLRHVPAEEPTAWRWTDEEIKALMPALEAIAERYEITATVNEHAPNAGAALTVLMHANRSLAAERAWRAAHGPTDQLEEPADVLGPPTRPEPVSDPERAGDGSVREPAGAEPGAPLDPAAKQRVDALLGGPVVRGGR